MPFVKECDVSLVLCGAQCLVETDKVPVEELIGSPGTLGISSLPFTVDFSEEA